jgi:hypothetical protein
MVLTLSREVYVYKPLVGGAGAAVGRRPAAGRVRGGGGLRHGCALGQAHGTGRAAAHRVGCHCVEDAADARMPGRGLQSSTFLIKLSAFCGIRRVSDLELKSGRMYAPDARVPGGRLWRRWTRRRATSCTASSRRSTPPAAGTRVTTIICQTA